MAEGRFYEGTSGIVLPVSNKAQFPVAYQNKSRLNFYASLHNSVEINSSFYKIPQSKTVARWSADVRENFKFTFKLWKGITHNKNLSFDPADVAHFMEVVGNAGRKKGCLLVQFPASIKAQNMPQLKKLLDTIQKHNRDIGWHLAVEFRSKTWYNQNTYDVLRMYSTALVIHDMPASATPLTEIDNQFVYLRFHGPGGRYSGSYDDSFLSEYARYINEWLYDGKEVYCYFNNTMGDAVKNLDTLKKYVNRL